MKDTRIPRESREFRGVYSNYWRSRYRAIYKPKATIEIAKGNVPKPSI